mgnify:CR=1 FL=1
MSVRKGSIRLTGLALALFAALHGTAAAAPGDNDTTPAAPADAAADKAKTLESVSAIGQGEVRQVQRITVEDVKILPPGTSALRARITVEPGITAPTTGTASSKAARNSVK